MAKLATARATQATRATPSTSRSPGLRRFEGETDAASAALAAHFASLDSLPPPERLRLARLVSRFPHLASGQPLASLWPASVRGVAWSDAGPPASLSSLLGDPRCAPPRLDSRQGHARGTALPSGSRRAGIRSTWMSILTPGGSPLKIMKSNEIKSIDF